MLNPNTRGLYTTALTPPLGMVFDEALGMTFSLDPSVLLTVPVHLAILACDEANPLRDGIAVLEAMRRLADRITVFAQRGRLQVPTPPNPLYGLLESMVVEVTAPRGGVFHPKLWVLRFRQAQGDGALLRVLVMSRNLTLDRSWDLALTLEGIPGGRYVAENRPLGELIAAAPDWSTGRSIDDARRAQAERLAEELRKTRLDPPAGYEGLAFHVLGRSRGPWSPGPSNRLAVISPFLGDDALSHLCSETANPAAVVSRPEALAALSPASRQRFQQRLTLHDAAETEDGEAVDGEARDTCGLHAKAYILERGWRTHLFVGSANATDAALLGTTNVEVLAELVGKRSQIGGIDSLLSAEGLGEVLTAFDEPDGAPARDVEREAAEAALDETRRLLERSLLRVRCVRSPDGGDRWNLFLQAPEGVHAAGGLASVRAWPITIPSERATALDQADLAEGVDLGEYGAASVTGLVAFEITTRHPQVVARLVLNLPVDDPPAERDDAILQTVVRNREGFLRYLMLLLSGLNGDSDLPGLPPPSGNGDQGWQAGGFDDLPLLEEMVRAYCRDPRRLHEVDEVVRRLAGTSDSDEAVVPETFLALWRVFESALGAHRG